MRALVVGATGMLGTDLAAALRDSGHEVLAPALDELDITDPSSVAAIALERFDWCFNCAAYTAVDKAETDERPATEVNAIGPGYLAAACLTAGARILHVSTDFVFDGNSSEPYREDDPTNPLGVYGRTKRDGEEAVMAAHQNALVVRTAWLYGPNGPSFPKTMIKAWKAGKPLRVVADQVGSPTYTADLAKVLVQIAESNPFPGIYHAVGPARLTWHSFALLAIRTYQEATHDPRQIAITPISSSDWPTPAKRPKYSVLSTSKLEGLGIPPMRATSEALSEFCARLICDGGVD